MLTVVDRAICPENFGYSEPEDYRFVRAFQDAGIADFEFGYLVFCRNGIQISVVPYFLTDYHLNTLVTNAILKRLLAPVHFKVACVGHPSTDSGWIEGEASQEVLNIVNRTLRKKAAAIAYKWFRDPLPLEGFVEVVGLPINVLRIAGTSYLAALPGRKRRNILKKVAKSASLDFREFTPTNPLPPALVDPVYELYRKTADRSNIEFERLNPRYFELTAAISTYLLAYEGNRLIGFVQWIRKANRTVGKYVGLDYERSRAYELYFGLIIRSIENGLRDGITEFELGPLSYYSKRLLGAELISTRLYYRHHNVLVHWVLEKCRFLLEPSAQELQ
jgi:hypothetical protein